MARWHCGNRYRSPDEGEFRCFRRLSLKVDDQTIAPGQIVYPGFDADVLWKFRWYSPINQVLVWTTIGVVLGALIQRLVAGGGKPTPATPMNHAAPVA